MKFVDLCCNDIEAKSSFWLFATAEKSAAKRLFAFSTFNNHYNDNRKSKFLNFDRKAKLSEQISKRKFVDFCFSDIEAKSSFGFFQRLKKQPRKGFLPFQNSIVIITFIYDNTYGENNQEVSYILLKTLAVPGHF